MGEIIVTPTFTKPCPFSGVSLILHVLVSSLYCGLVYIEGYYCSLHVMYFVIAINFIWGGGTFLWGVNPRFPPTLYENSKGEGRQRERMIS